MLPAYRSSSCALVGELARAEKPRYVRGYDPREAALAFALVIVLCASAVALYIVFG